jgi:hypothetical protein
MKKERLSKADMDALARMPEGWFCVDEVPYMVRCPGYRCQRLEKRGKLESRVVGDNPRELTREYRKI